MGISKKRVLYIFRNELGGFLLAVGNPILDRSNTRLVQVKEEFLVK